MREEKSSIDVKLISIRSKAFALRARVALVLLAMALPGAADDALDSLLQLSLEDLANIEVITPTQTRTPLALAPGAVTLITREMIDRSAARTIPELLRMVPGVNVRWNPMVQTISIRGFGSNPFTSRVLLLIDGIPYNSWNKGGFPQHPGFDFFNIDIVERLEVVRGAGSALYGENALNGMINIITLNGGSERGRTRASISAGDRDTRVLTASYDQSFSDDAGVLVAARHIESQLPLEFWMENDAQASGYDVYLKARAAGFTASLYRREDSFDGYVDVVGSPTLPPDSVFRSADKIEQTINIASLGYEYAPDPDRWSLRSNVSFSNRDGSHCASCHARAQDPEFEKTDDHGSQAFANIRVESGQLGRHRALIGAEWRRIRSGDHSEELHGASHVSGVTHSDAVLSYRKSALFVQDEISLIDERLTLIGGLRYETQTSPKLFDSQWFPRISAVFEVTDRSVVRASFSQAARYPSFSELYQSSWFVAAEFSTGIIPLGSFTPNAELAPEKITAFELGGEYRWNERWKGKIDFFRNVVTDPIAMAYGLFRNENHPQDMEVWGAETEIHGQPLSWLSGYANWSYHRHSRRGNGTDSVGQELDTSYAPRHQINLALNVDPTPNFHTRLEVSWRDEYTAPAFWYPIAFGDPTVRPLDAYALVNLKTEYKLPFFTRGGERPLSVSLLLRNLADERPFETVTGFDARLAGREAFVTLRYQRSNR